MTGSGADISALGELVERLPAAVYCTTPEGKFAAANDALARLLGYESAQDLFSLDVADIYADPADRRSMIDRVARREVLAPETVELRRRDGSKFWGRITSTAVRKDDGTVATYEGIIEDVTEERRAADELRHTNALLDALSEVQGRFIVGEDVADTFERLLTTLLRLTDSEYGFIGEVLADGDGNPYLRTHAITNIAWSPETRAFYDEYAPNNMEFHNRETLFGAVMTSGAPVIANDPATDRRRGGLPDGHPALDAFLGVPLYTGPNLVGMAGIANRPGGYHAELLESLEPFFATCAGLIQAVRNDAARKAAETQVKVREERLGAIVNLAVEGIVVFDQAGVIESFNPAAEQMFGYRAADAVGQSVLMLVPEEHRDDYLRIYADLAEAGTVEMLGLRNDGTTIAMEVSFSRAVSDGDEALTAVIRNVTERKEAEAALRAAHAAAEEASRAKDEFLAGMSHELRTPLNGVIGLATILARGTHGRLTAKQQEYVEQIEASGRHLLELINAVLDLAKIQAERLELDRAPASLTDVIEGAAALMRETALGAGLRLMVDLDPSLPELMEIDALRIKQVLLNLLSNAVKFTPTGGHVEVEARLDDRCVAISVADNGIGIPKSKQAKLFQPFEQVDSSLTREQPGTGLGLALSRRLVELHGGRIDLESSLGEGSRFTVKLPLHAVPEAPGRDPAAAFQEPLQRARRGATVLLVEDNELNRRVVTDYLEASGYVVVHAADGGEAIDQAESIGPDIVLMDIQLPVMDGLTATRKLKARSDLQDIPVVALTALAMPGDAERCLDAGCDAYLSKPVDPDDVVAIIEQQLGRSRPLRQTDPRDAGSNIRGAFPPTIGLGADKAKPTDKDGQIA